MSKVFAQYIREVDESVNAALSKIQHAKKSPVVQRRNFLEELELLLGEIVGTTFKDKNLSSMIKLDAPPSQVKADYAISTFELAKTIQKDPHEIARILAKAIAEKIGEDIQKTEIAGPYINITLDQQKLYATSLEYVSNSGKNYGRSSLNTGKVALIDFSSPNIAKPLGIGHLRSTIIGHALANIYEWTGYSVIRDNHLGDWGTQFGALIYAYQAWGSDEVIAKNPIRELKNLYVRFHEEVKINPSIKVEARRLFNELEKGNDPLLALWKKFRDWSIADFQKTYQRMGIRFDTYIGEGFFAQKTDDVITTCLTSGVCKKDTHSAVVFVDSLDDLPSFILRKQDGSSLYMTRDLVTLQYRIKQFKPDVILYVVGSEQSLNFRQLFALARKVWSLPTDVQIKHVAFGMVLSGGKKMATRRGTVIELEAVITKAVEKAREILQSSGSNFNNQEMDEISEIIGMGSILYNDLRQSRTTDISFDWNRMVALEAGSSAYLQYTFVRIASILTKAGEGAQEIPKQSFPYQFKHPKEFDLAKHLLLFPKVIRNAQQADAPHIICTYLEELAQRFNSFYADVQVIGTIDAALFASRIALLRSVAQVLENGLKILGIKIPRRM